MCVTFRAFWHEIFSAIWRSLPVVASRLGIGLRIVVGIANKDGGVRACSPPLVGRFGPSPVMLGAGEDRLSPASSNLLDVHPRDQPVAQLVDVSGRTIPEQIAG
jgi:hypothetical protein